MLSVVDGLEGGAWLLRAAGLAAADGVGVVLARNAIGLVVCGAFVHLSGHVVARRDIGGGHPVPANTLARAVRAATRLFAPPLLVGAWSLSFAAGVLLLAPGFDVVATALVSLTIAVTVRTAAYYSEGFAETLATMLPFSLLGLVVLDGVASWGPATAGDTVVRLLAHWPVTVYGLSALLLVEVLLRTADLVCRR